MRKMGSVPIYLLFLAACAGRVDEENFQRVMDRQVGKNADDFDFYPLLYRLRLANVQRLQNGTTREEYAAGPKGKCRLYFDVSAARKVVGWSAEGDSDCVIPRSGRTP